MADPERAYHAFAKTPTPPGADKAGSAQARDRSEGWCEVRWFGATGAIEYRCDRAATQVHHMLSGRGTRGKGLSALKEHKQHVCDQCHLDITGGVGGRKLLRVGGQRPHWTDRYQRVEIRRRA
ncbi:MAG: hypothetical protein GEV06_19650 [Luteitalea sp.]|nr:hypothetical protein [Luteitalea sp.]